MSGWDGLERLDFVDGGPLLSGYEQAVMLGVVGDAAEDGLAVDPLLDWEQAREIDPGDYVAVLRGEAGDAVGVQMFE